MSGGNGSEGIFSHAAKRQALLFAQVAPMSKRKQFARNDFIGGIVYNSQSYERPALYNNVGVHSRQPSSDDHFSLQKSNTQLQLPINMKEQCLYESPHVHTEAESRGTDPKSRHQTSILKESRFAKNPNIQPANSPQQDEALNSQQGPIVSLNYINIGVNDQFTNGTITRQLKPRQRIYQPDNKYNQRIKAEDIESANTLPKSIRMRNQDLYDNSVSFQDSGFVDKKANFYQKIPQSHLRSQEVLVKYTSASELPTEAPSGVTSTTKQSLVAQEIKASLKESFDQIPIQFDNKYFLENNYNSSTMVGRISPLIEQRDVGKLKGNRDVETTIQKQRNQAMAVNHDLILRQLNYEPLQSLIHQGVQLKQKRRDIWSNASHAKLPSRQKTRRQQFLDTVAVRDNIEKVEDAKRKERFIPKLPNNPNYYAASMLKYGGPQNIPASRDYGNFRPAPKVQDYQITGVQEPYEQLPLAIQKMNDERRKVVSLEIRINHIIHQAGKNSLRLNSKFIFFKYLLDRP